MKTSLLAALLALTVVTPRSASPRGEVVPVAMPGAIAPPPSPAPRPAGPVAGPLASAALQPIEAPVPADIKVEIQRDGANHAWIRVHRRGQVITLQRGAERVVGADRAQLRVARGEEGDVPVIWEATAPTSLATVRGLVVVAASPDATTAPTVALRLVAAPAALAHDEGSRHACVAQDDARGGFTVLCRVDAMASAMNLTAASPREGITIVSEQRGLVRLDLPAPEAGVAATVVGYTDGFNGVVIRAEASRLAGEERATITVASASRPQPLAPPRRRWGGWREPMLDPF